MATAGVYVLYVSLVTYLLGIVCSVMCYATPTYPFLYPKEAEALAPGKLSSKTPSH